MRSPEPSCTLDTPRLVQHPTGHTTSAAPRSAWTVTYTLVAFVVIVRVALVHQAGFVGISDDDAARTLIAWQFARTPSIDPTRSSWLPVHSYLLGAALALTHELQWTPRVLSLFGALATALIALGIARRLGASPCWAALGSIAALAFPWSAWCAWAAGVPEMPCTALTLAGVALAMDALARSSRPLCWWLAGTILSLACGHRYEAWFASAGVLVAIVTLQLERRSWREPAALGAGIALVPLFWLAINHVRSGNALDFVSRVMAYRAAHEVLPPFSVRLVRYPTLLLFHSGAATLIALAGVRWLPRTAVIPLAAAGAVVAGLVFTDVRGGGATHHIARSLLPSVWLIAPVAFSTLGRWWSTHTRRRAVVAAATVVCGMQSSAGSTQVPRDVQPETLAAGRAVITVSTPETCYFVETGRLDFLWLELASGAPERAVPDRPYGAPPPVPGRWPFGASRCTAAAVHSDTARAMLQNRGWHDVSQHGPWRVMVPERHAVRQF